MGFRFLIESALPPAWVRYRCGKPSDMIRSASATPSLPAAAGDRLLAQPEAAAYLGVSVSYLRASNCPKRLLPGTGPKGKPLVRYRLSELDAWADSYRLDPR